MINFKQPDEVLPSAVNVVAIAIIAATLVSVLFEQPASKLVNQHASQRRLMQRQIVDAKAHSADELKTAREKVWTGNTERVSADVLAQVTKAALSRSLKLSAFRPQRAVSVGDLIEVPYTVQIGGSYTAIRAVARVLDDKASKIVLRSMQISASGEETNSVSATFGLSVYIPGQFVADELAAADARSAPVKPGARMHAATRPVKAVQPKGAHHA